MPCSDRSLEAWRRRLWSRSVDGTQGASRDVTPKSRIDSVDIRGSGSWFSEVQESYPSQLDFDDETDRIYVADSSAAQTPTTAGSPSPHQLSRLSTTSGTVSSPPRISEREQYNISTAFLDPAHFDDLRRIRNRSLSSGPTDSAGHDTGSSDYLSARDYRTWHNTEGTESTGADEDGGDQEGDNGLERQETPYFTPSHTPSHRSQGTILEDDDPEGRAPDSPHPRSNFYPYDSRYGLRAMDGVEEADS